MVFQSHRRQTMLALLIGNLPVDEFVDDFEHPIVGNRVLDDIGRADSRDDFLNQRIRFVSPKKTTK